MSRCKRWNSHSLNSSTEASDCFLRTLKKKKEKCVKHGASLILHYTLNALSFRRKKGKSNSSFLAKAQSFCQNKKQTKKKKDWYSKQLLLPLLSFSRDETREVMRDLFRLWCIKGRKTNRTFAKNILVFVPLQRCQSWSRWYNKENDTTIVKKQTKKQQIKLTYCLTRGVN